MKTMKTIRSNPFRSDASCLRRARWIAGALLAVATTAAATDFYWDNINGGSFDDDANWDQTDTPFFTTDRTFFNLDAATAYAVTLDDTFSIGSLEVMTDRVILDLTHDLYLNEATSGTHAGGLNEEDWRTALMVGRGTPEPNLAHTQGELTLIGGGTLFTEGLTLGGTSGSTGVLTLQRADAFSAAPRLEATSADTTIVGLRGHGELNVLDGAQVALGGHLIISRRAPPSGRVNTVTVDGMGSSLSTADASIAYRGRGDVFVRNGAAMTAARFYLAPSAWDGGLYIESGGTVTLSRFMHAGADTLGRITGTVEIRGAGSALILTGATTAGGGSFGSAYGSASDQGNTAFLTLEDGGRAEFSHDLTFWSKSTLTIDGVRLETHPRLKAAELTVVEGAKFDATLNTGEFTTAIEIGGDVDLGNWDFTLLVESGFNATPDEDVFTLLTYTGTLTGSFLGLNDGDTIESGGYEFQLGYGSRGDDAITLAVIPEPGTLVLLLAAGGLLALRRRRG